MEGTKRIIGIFLVVLVLFFTAIAILSIWEVIAIERIMNKSFKTLFVLFAATFVVLFVSNAFLGKGNGKQDHPSTPG